MLSSHMVPFTTLSFHNSVDVVFASQSFHHADDPMMFLHEMKKILKDTGIIIMIGEHKIDSFIAPKSDADLDDHYTLHNLQKCSKIPDFHGILLEVSK